MNKILVVLCLISSFSITDIVRATPLYYTFEGPSTLVFMGDLDAIPPEIDTDNTYQTGSEDGCLWRDSSDFGNIFHVILIDFDEYGTITDSEGNVTTLAYACYADYLWGSLVPGTVLNDNQPENNYLIDMSPYEPGGAKELRVSYGDKQLHLSSPGELFAHPDFGGNWDIGNHVAGGYLKITGISETMPIPEPTTLILIGSGLIGIAAFRKKLMK